MLKAVIFERTVFCTVHIEVCVWETDCLPRSNRFFKNLSACRATIDALFSFRVLVTYFACAVELSLPIKQTFWFCQYV